MVTIKDYKKERKRLANCISKMDMELGYDINLESGHKVGIGVTYSCNGFYSSDFIRKEITLTLIWDNNGSKKSYETYTIQNTPDLKFTSVADSIFDKVVAFAKEQIGG